VHGGAFVEIKACPVSVDAAWSNLNGPIGGSVGETALLVHPGSRHGGPAPVLDCAVMTHGLTGRALDASSGTPSSWPVGRLIVHRSVRRGQIGWARTARVVSDDERGLLVWIARHSPVADQVCADGRGMRAMPFTEWITLEYRLRVGTWTGPGVLKFLPTGAAHSVWWMRDAAGAFSNWYVNLEQTGVRWADAGLAGVDIVDQDLDVVIDADGSWRWKDEGEFAERLALPEHYWVNDPDAVRAEGRRVVELARQQLFPFDGTWCDFQPPTHWVTVPTLPTGWDRPSARPADAA